MGDIKAITTYYDGYPFRSRLEARWAVFFNEMGIEYEYEPEGFILSDGTYYLPDFYLPGFHVFFEVKAKHLLGTKEGDEAIRKISDGMRTNSWAGIIAFGDPMDDKAFIYCQTHYDAGLAEYKEDYENRVSFGQYDFFDEGIIDPVLFTEDKICRFLYDKIAEDGEIIECTNDGIVDALTLGQFKTAKIFKNKTVLRAAEKARQTRFEHGETPKGRTKQ